MVYHLGLLGQKGLFHDSWVPFEKMTNFGSFGTIMTNFGSFGTIFSIVIPLTDEAWIVRLPLRSITNK